MPQRINILNSPCFLITVKMQDADFNEISGMLSEFNTKIVDLEGRYELLKERMLVSNESFIKTRDNLSKDIRVIKDDIREIRSDIDRIKEMVQHVIGDTAGFARKEELRILERYMKLWEPLKFVKAEEVKRMIDDALENLQIKKEEVKS